MPKGLLPEVLYPIYKFNLDDVLALNDTTNLALQRA